MDGPYITCLLVGTKMNEKTKQKQSKQKQSKQNIINVETPSINDLMKSRQQRRYFRAVKQLGIIRQKEKEGIRPKSSKHLRQQMRMREKYQYIIGKYLTARARKARQSGKFTDQISQVDPSCSVQPFKDITTDPLCMALGAMCNGICVPIRKEWSAIKSELKFLVTSYIMANRDNCSLPSYDSTKIFRGFRIIKCMDEFSKEFILDCFNSIRDILKDLNLVLIPPAEIPRDSMPPIDLREEESGLKVRLDTADLAKKPEKVTSVARKEFSNKRFKTQHSQIRKDASNFRENAGFQTSLDYDVTRKTAKMHEPSVCKSEKFPGNLLIKQYMTQQPQTSRNNADRSLQNPSYPSGNSSFDSPPRNYDPTHDYEFPSTSCQSRNYFNSGVELEFNERLPASNETSWHGRERNPVQTLTLTDSEAWRRSSDFSPNLGSNKSQSHQDSRPSCSNPYRNQNRNDRLPISNETSRLSRERYPAQMHSDDWRRSPDLYENSSSNRIQSYQDSPLRRNSPYRNKDDRLPAFYETSNQSRERNSTQTRRRSPDFYANSGSNRKQTYQDSPPRRNSPYKSRGDRLSASYETARQSRERNWRRSPEFYANSGSNVRQYYHDSPPHSSNFSRAAKQYNSRQEESYRSNEFRKVTPERNFENFSNYFLQSEPREENILPRDDYDIPPPPPRWRDFDNERDNDRESSRISNRSRESRRNRRY